MRGKNVPIPDMEGMSAPTQITMQAPSKTKISKAVFVFLCFSMNLFKGDGGIFLFEELGLWYVESSSSDAWWLGSKQNFAFLQRCEYKATIPPAQVKCISTTTLNSYKLKRGKKIKIALTFTIIICIQRDNGILQQRNKRQSPKNQRKCTKYCILILNMFQSSRKYALIDIKRGDAQVTKQKA